MLWFFPLGGFAMRKALVLLAASCALAGCELVPLIPQILETGTAIYDALKPEVPKVRG